MRDDMPVREVCRPRRYETTSGVVGSREDFDPEIRLGDSQRAWLGGREEREGDVARGEVLPLSLDANVT